MTNSFINLLSHPQLRETVVDKLHHGTICMISITCKELFQLQDSSLEVRLKPKSRIDGECIGSISMIQYANLSINETLTETLAASGCISALSYCFQMGAIKTTGPILMAATNGQTDTVRYLHKNGCLWHDEVPTFVAKNGHIETLQYCIENGCPWSVFAPISAAEKGYIEILKYFHKSGCPFDDDGPEIAAEVEHIEMLKYCIENGCTYSQERFRYAKENGIV